MKIKIVFTPKDNGDLFYMGVVGDDGSRLPSETIGVWLADGDVEALELDVLPPLDKVTLTVVEPGPKGDRTEMTYLTPDEMETLRALRSGRAVVTLKGA